MAGKRFEFLEHTADAKFRAYGGSIEEAFSNAALAMFSVMVDTSKVEKNIRKDINAKGDDEKSLLYDFLEKLIILLDDGFLLNSVERISIKDGKKLKAIVAGDKIGDKYDVHGEVKAATYNEMEIISEKGKFIVQAVVDL